VTDLETIERLRSLLKESPELPPTLLLAVGEVCGIVLRLRGELASAYKRAEILETELVEGAIEAGRIIATLRAKR
jgi:hypothetical protein